MVLHKCLGDWRRLAAPFEPRSPPPCEHEDERWQRGIAALDALAQVVADKAAKAIRSQVDGPVDESMMAVLEEAARKSSAPIAAVLQRLRQPSLAVRGGAVVDSLGIAAHYLYQGML
eukprot:TRINITY_DN31041_c0_g1_i5.p1 TRINITY_DN31041_c0_g1~~TRINITY_DN31041_c0_g1_i5.p1  ORF type:complete len:117 (+),score=20.29 TRINITY_DN31041_c0_g1_i5:255-605(+)